jgi:hypothetical protein
MISLPKIRQIIEKEGEGPTLDYKEDLPLETDGDKAQFVKDAISLANSGQKAYIITGVEDGTWKLVGIKTHHKAEQLNQILKDKSDPPLRVEYVEKKIMGHTVGVIEINGDNPPYIVSVPDRFGGPLSSDPTKQFWIERGTIFVRNYNMNEGARRADLERIYKVKYITLESDLRISHDVSAKPIDDLTQAEIKFTLINYGNVLATQPYIFIQFRNVKEIVKCGPLWANVSYLNNNIPTIRFSGTIPVCPTIHSAIGGATVSVSKGVNQIEADITLGASNMRFKEGRYTVPLQPIKAQTQENV